MDNETQKRKRREEFCKKAKELGVLDGAFQIVRYNKYYRSIDGHPIPEEIAMYDVFPDSDNRVEAIIKAESLYNSSSEMVRYSTGSKSTEEMVKILKIRYPGFSEESYKTVLGRANYMAVK